MTTVTVHPDMGVYDDLLETLNPTQAMTLLHRLREQFNWAGTMFTRVDVEDMWNQSEELVKDLGEFDESHWERFQHTWEWRKGIEEQACQAGWDMIGDALWNLQKGLD